MTNESLITIKCTTCGGKTPFNADATACPHCGGNLRQLAAKTCNNCELEYNPYSSSSHCPSCHLGITEIVCAHCGLFYSPYDIDGNRAPCPGCRSQPSLPPGSGRLEYERPIEDGQDPEEEDDTPEEEPTYFDIMYNEEEAEEEPGEVDVVVETWIESAMSSWMETSMETSIGTLFVSWIDTVFETCMETEIVTWIATQLETCLDTIMASWVEMETGTCVGTDYDDTCYIESWIVTGSVPCTDLHYSTHIATEIKYCTRLHYRTCIATALETWIEHLGTSYLATGIDSWIESDVLDYPDDTDGPDKSDVPTDTDVPEDEDIEDTDCPCDNKDNNDEPAGTSSGDNACVDFNIAFGRTPLIPGMDIGRLSLYSGMLDGSLANAGALTYDHITQRRLYAVEEDQPDVTSGPGAMRVGVSGGARGKGARSSKQIMLGQDAASGTRMTGSRNSRDIMTPVKNELTGRIDSIEETMGDGTVLHYDRATGFLSWIKLPCGRIVTRQEMNRELIVIRSRRSSPDETINDKLTVDNLAGASRRPYGFIRQIWNKTDGLLDIITSPPNGRGQSSYIIAWYSPEHIGAFNTATKLYPIASGAQPIKSWIVRTELADYSLTPGSLNTGTVRGTIVTYPSGGSYPQNTAERTPTLMNERVGEVKTSLKSLEIIEKRGELSFPIRWEQPNLTTLTFKRGTGSEAEVCIKKREGALGGRMTVAGTSQLSPMMSLTLPDGAPAFPKYLGGHCSKADGYKLTVNGYNVDEVIDTKYRYKGEGPYTDNKIESATRTIRKRYGFGDVVVSEEKGYGSPDCRKTIHYHDTLKTSRTYGRRLMSILPDGTNISFNYDKEGRLIKKTKMWIGGGAQITRCTWCNSRPNDRRPATVTTWIKRDGQYAMINRKCYAYLESDALRRETVTVRGRGMSGTSVTTREWYGPDPSKNGQACAWAASRPKLIKHGDGTETTYAYRNTDEHGAIYKVEAVTGTGGGAVAHRSTMEVSHINAGGQVTVRSHYVHMGTRSDLPGVTWYGDTPFKLVARDTMEYDLSDKPTKVTGLDGRIRTTEWICKGPLNQTDENGITTTYRYNSAKQLSHISRPAIQWNPSAS